MNKKLIALALIALPAAAMADVTLYGIMKIGLDNNVSDIGNGSSSVAGVHDYGSRVGIKGEEDLGNGLKAIWQVETKVHLNSGDGALAARDSFVGIATDNFGKIRLGHLSTELNSPLSLVDIWEYDQGQNGLLAFTRTGDRLQNAIRYDSPDFYGFNFNAIYGFGENQISTGTGIDRKYTSGLGLNYQNSGFFASYGYEQRGRDYLDKNGNAKTGYIHRLEAGYDANNLFVGFGYQYANAALDTSWIGVVPGMPVTPSLSTGYKTSEFVFSTSYAFGAIKPKFSYAHGLDIRGQNVAIHNSGYDQFILGVDYALSKRTTAGLSVGHTVFNKAFNQVNDSDIKVTTYGVNLIHHF